MTPRPVRYCACSISMGLCHSYQITVNIKASFTSHCTVASSAYDDVWSVSVSSTLPRAFLTYATCSLPPNIGFPLKLRPVFSAVNLILLLNIIQPWFLLLFGCRNSHLSCNKPAVQPKRCLFISRKNIKMMSTLAITSPDCLNSIINPTNQYNKHMDWTNQYTVYYVHIANLVTCIRNQCKCKSAPCLQHTN